MNAPDPNIYSPKPEHMWEYVGRFGITDDGRLIYITEHAQGEANACALYTVDVPFFGPISVGSKPCMTPKTRWKLFGIHLDWNYEHGAFKPVALQRLDSGKVPDVDPTRVAKAVLQDMRTVETRIKNDKTRGLQTQAHTGIVDALKAGGFNPHTDYASYRPAEIDMRLVQFLLSQDEKFGKLLRSYMAKYHPDANQRITEIIESFSRAASTKWIGMTDYETYLETHGPAEPPESPF